MSRIPPRLANQLWQLSCRAHWRRFQRAAGDVRTTQRDKLRGYLQANAQTDYGRRFDFATIDTIAAYQQRLPLTTYDDYAAEIEAMAQGRAQMLSASPLRMFELSSGSTAASKLIPYTDALKVEFQAGISAWVYHLFHQQPALKRGSAYWSITPLTAGRKTTSGGIPIGFEADSAYLGSLGRYLVDALLAVPNAVKDVPDMPAFRYITLRFLLARADLSIISVWNPTFLSLLLAPLDDWWDGLLADIQAGTLSPPVPLDPALHRRLLAGLRPDLRRAAQLSALRPDDYRQIWPDLNLISCWMDGPSATHAAALRAQFPEVAFQGKGLIATEAFVSFPVSGCPGAVLAIDSHFFEFLPLDPATRQLDVSALPRLAHQLEMGQQYGVVVTTGGGLYRYQLGDIVEVVGHYQQAPCLRFVGKSNRVSDWFGEKLNERFVAGVLDALLAAHDLPPTFALLAPDDHPAGFCYTLYLETSQPPSPAAREALAGALDARLRENFHYDYCCRLGQLNPARVVLVTGGAAVYLNVQQARGLRLGDVKPAALDGETGWGVWFEPSP